MPLVRLRPIGIPSDPASTFQHSKNGIWFRIVYKIAVNTSLGSDFLRFPNHNHRFHSVGLVHILTKYHGDFSVRSAAVKNVKDPDE